MKIIFSLCAFGLLLATIQLAAQVSPPDRRQELLTKAERLLSKEISPEIRIRFEAVADPFYSPVLKEEIEESDAALVELEIELSDEVILSEISALINPGGVLKRGTETLLVIEDNRIPVGQFLSVRYKGQDYRIQLVKADARSFVLRLNDEIVTKKIR